MVGGRILMAQRHWTYLAFLLLNVCHLICWGCLLLTTLLRVELSANSSLGVSGHLRRPGFSQLANSDERKLRQPRLFLSSIFLAVLFFVCKLLNRLFGNSANWSAFPDRCPCDLARPRLGRRTIGQIQETEVVFFHVACVHVACPVHGREDCWVEKPRPRS